MDVEYIINNYLWIIIVAFILLMAVIGFIADKTHFIESNKKKEKKTTDEDSNEPIQEPVVDLNNTPLYDAIRKAAGADTINDTSINKPQKDMSLDSKEQTSEEIPNELFEPLNSDENNNADDDMDQIKNANQKFNVEKTEENLIDDVPNKLETDTEIPSELFEPLNSSNEQNIEEFSDTEEFRNTEKNLESKAMISKEVEDDVWKF